MSAIPKRLLFGSLVAFLVFFLGFCVYLWFNMKQKPSVAKIKELLELRLQTGDLAGAKLEAKKWVGHYPEDAEGHFTRAQLLLRDKDISHIRASDSDGLQAVRSLIKTVKHRPDNREALELLIRYFLSIGDATEAGNYAKRLLEQEPESTLGHYGVALSMIFNGQRREALPKLQFVLKNEKPIPHPRSTRLALELTDIAPNPSEWKNQIIANLQAYDRAEVQWEQFDDQLALIELRTWRSRETGKPEVFTAQVQGALKQLETLTDGETNDRTALQVLIAASNLLPDRKTLSPALQSTRDQLQPQVESLVDRLYQKAVEQKVLDPRLYVSYAERLRGQDKLAAAVELVQNGLKLAETEGKDTRTAFLSMDLWLAEHYIAQREFEKADPYINNLLGNDMTRPHGSLLRGYQRISVGAYDDAAVVLQKAVEGLPGNGPAKALFGLCQLRRGFISEGRQYLEAGIQLGADSPQYKTWLAMALAQAGYHDKAVKLSQNVLNHPKVKVVGHSLLAQLYLRAGQLEDAERELNAALAEANTELRPQLQLTQAELALQRRDWKAAQVILNQLKTADPAIAANNSETIAPQAFVLEYQYLLESNQTEAAMQVLQQARQRFPTHPLLLGLEVRQLVATNQKQPAIDLLRSYIEKNPDQIQPRMLLSDVYEQVQNDDFAMIALEEAVVTFPSESSLQVRLIEKYLSRKQFDKAQNELARLKENAQVTPATLDYLNATLADLQNDTVLAEQITRAGIKRDPDNPALKFLMGKLEYAKGNYSEAARLFQESLNAGTFRQQTVVALFETYLRLGELAQAEQLLDLATRRSLEVGNLPFQLLQLYARQGKWEQVDARIAKLLQSQPSEDLFTLLIALQRGGKRFDQANQLIQTGLQQFPNSPKLLVQKITLLMDQRQFAPAEQLLTQVQQTMPDDLTLKVLAIHLRLESNRLAEADQLAQAAVQVAPNNPAVVAYRIKTLLATNQADAALKFASQAKQQYPELADAHYLLAHAYEGMGQPEQALAQLQTVLQANPKNEAAAQHYIRLLVGSGATEKLEATIQQLRTNNPRSPILLGVLGEYYAANNDLEQTQSILKQLEDLKAKGPIVPYLRAVIAFAQRDFASAQQNLRAALAEPTGHIPSTFLLARLLAQQERFADALQLLDQVRSTEVTMIPAHLLYGQVLYSMGKFEEAERECRQLLQKFPNAKRFRLLLTQILIKRATPAGQQEAVQLAQRELANGENNPMAIELYLKVLFDAKQTAAAQQLIRSHRQNSDFQLAAAKASYAADQPILAIECCEGLLTRSGNTEADQRWRTEAMLVLADSLVKKSELASGNSRAADLQKAASYYRQILQAQPNSVVAANNLAWMLGEHLDQPQLGLEELTRVLPREALEKNLLPVEILDTLGNLYLKSGQLPKAQKVLQEAVQRNPQSASAHFHLAQVFEKQNRRELADNHFRLAARYDQANRFQQGNLNLNLKRNAQ